MKKFLYGILFMIGLRRLAQGLILILDSEPVRSLVEDVTFTVVDRTLNGHEDAAKRLRQHTRKRTRANSRVHSVPDQSQPYDHEANGL